MKEKDTESSEQDLRERVIRQFMDTIREMVTLEIGNNPDIMEQKEAVNVAQYIQKSVFEVFRHWTQYKRFPIFQLVIFGDHKGGSMVQMDLTPSPIIQEMWQLRDLSRMLKETIDAWDLKIQESGGGLPDMEMGKVKADISAYQAIADHIKKGE